MTRILLCTLVLLSTFFSTSSSLGAPSAGRPFFLQKQEQKEIHRWSLAEWLDTRDRMRMMDLWLAIHSPSPYEFYLSASHKSGWTTQGNYYGGWDAAFAAYATIFGLEIIRQTSNAGHRWLGLVHFRLIGYHNQATNLTFHGGVKQEERLGTEVWNPVAGVSITMYFMKHFGIAGLYRHTFPQSVKGLSTLADRLEAGAFIDFSFVRVYADYFSDIETDDPSVSARGIQLGARLYF